MSASTPLSRDRHPFFPPQQPGCPGSLGSLLLKCHIGRTLLGLIASAIALLLLGKPLLVHQSGPLKVISSDVSRHVPGHVAAADREEPLPHAAGPPPSGQGSASSLEGRATHRREQHLESGTGAQVPSVTPTAICLVGGARSFEATGPSIVQRMLPVFSPFDLFVHSPFDADSAKLWALADAVAAGGRDKLAHVRVFANLEVDESLYPRGLLRAAGSPNAVQGLLQYFRMVEGCVPMIKEHEAFRRGIPYRWVVRARLDSYWSRPPSPLSAFNSSMGEGEYTIPYGSDYAGFNDRLGVGDRETSFAALRRLSVLEEVQNVVGETNLTLNSEMAFMLQMNVSGVAVARAHFPFCVLTRRLPVLRDGECGPPMASVSATAVLDGAKCAPCAPCTQLPSEWSMSMFYRNLSLPETDAGFVGVDSAAYAVCNFSTAWVEGQWQQTFDNAAGAELAKARESISSSSYGHCIQRMQEMKGKTVKWDAPTPAALCTRRHLGQVLGMGNYSDKVPTFTQELNTTSLVFLLTQDPGGVLDPADEAWGRHLTSFKGVRVVKRVRSEAELRRAFRKAGRRGPRGQRSKSKEVPRIDVVKVNARTPMPLKALQRLLSKPAGKALGFRSLPICQLLLVLPGNTSSKYSDFNTYRNLLLRFGYQLNSCLGGQQSGFHRCLYFSPEHCQYWPVLSRFHRKRRATFPWS